jgi:hypothetical protein
MDEYPEVAELIRQYQLEEIDLDIW